MIQRCARIGVLELLPLREPVNSALALASSILGVLESTFGTAAGAVLVLSCAATVSKVGNGSTRADRWDFGRYD